MKKTFYLDNAATTQVSEKIALALHGILSESYGNASSVHALGRKAKEALEKSREIVAKSIGASSEEIIFTSGGTESNNLAIKGIVLANKDSKKNQIIASVIEHPSVIETCKSLEKQGYSVDYIGVDKNGIVNLKELKEKISEKTLLVSIMHVNNEIGTIQPVEEIGKICKEKGIVFHTDAVQSFGKLKIDVNKMNISLLSASGHKLNAPKGVGFLYIRNGVRVMPILDGGGQERGLRSGTENVQGIVGLASALSLKRDVINVLKSRNKLIAGILKISGSKLNGDRDKRIYNNINVSFYGIEGEGLVLLLDKEGIYASTGSACSSHKLQESHVLRAIGVDSLYVHGSLRLTLDTLKALNNKEISFIVDKIRKSVETLREMSPFKFENKKIIKLNDRRKNG